MFLFFGFFGVMNIDSTVTTLSVCNTQSLDQKFAVGWKPYMSKTLPLLLLLFVKIADLQAYNVLNL